MRTIDLSTKMLAPVLVGFIMSNFGMVAGGIFIAMWNILSMVVEYCLLYNIYYTNENLQKPKLNVSLWIFFNEIIGTYFLYSIEN